MLLLSPKAIGLQAQSPFKFERNKRRISKMTTFLKLIGSAIGAVFGFVVLVALRGMLAPLLNEGSAFMIAVILAIVGLAIGTTIGAYEKDNGPVGILKANLVGVSFLIAMAVSVILAWFAITMLVPRAEPLTMTWLGAFSLVHAILFVAVPASSGFFIAGKLASSSKTSA